MRRPLILLALCGVLAACDRPVPIVEAAPDPCPPSAAAEPEEKPAAVALTDAQQLAVDVAVYGALGEALFVAREGAQVARDLWGDRQAQRVRQTRQWCITRP